jgi:hypothetical protein
VGVKIYLTGGDPSKYVEHFTGKTLAGRIPVTLWDAQRPVG